MLVQPNPERPKCIEYHRVSPPLGEVCAFAANMIHYVYSGSTFFAIDAQSVGSIPRALTFI